MKFKNFIVALVSVFFLLFVSGKKLNAENFTAGTFENSFTQLFQQNNSHPLKYHKHKPSGNSNTDIYVFDVNDDCSSAGYSANLLGLNVLENNFFPKNRFFKAEEIQTHNVYKAELFSVKTFILIRSLRI